MENSIPTMQALIDQLEYASAMTPHRGYSALFAAAADALRSLPDPTISEWRMANSDNPHSDSVNVLLRVVCERIETIRNWLDEAINITGANKELWCQLDTIDRRLQTLKHDLGFPSAALPAVPSLLHTLPHECKFNIADWKAHELIGRRCSLCGAAEAEVARLTQARNALVDAVAPLVARVHEDGVDAPYPEREWAPLLTKIATLVRSMA